jgi:hypothetical protein
MVLILHKKGGLLLFCQRENVLKILMTGHARRRLEEIDTKVFWYAVENFPIINKYRKAQERFKHFLGSLIIQTHLNFNVYVFDLWAPPI